MYPAATRGAPTAVTYGDLPAFDLPLALVYHTTETVNWAGFRFGLTAPHYSYKPLTREWRWHGASLDKRVGTMRSSRVTRTPANEKAVQVEIVAYSDANVAARNPKRVWVGDFVDHNYQDLALFTEWCHAETGIALAATPVPPGGWRYGSKSPYRLDRDVWLAFGGITAHGAVPGQSHWDTGVLDLERIATAAQDYAHNYVPPPPPPIMGDDDMTREDQMTTPEWVGNLSPDTIEAMFDSGIHGGSVDYWVNMLVNPTNPEWEKFRNQTIARRPYF